MAKNNIKGAFSNEAPQGALLFKLIAMKDKHKKHKHKASSDKDVLSQQDLIAGTSTFSFGGQPHHALETPEGKNNGAGPAVYQNQRKAQT